MQSIDTPEFLAQCKSEALAYIENRISEMRTFIYALEMGHDFLSQEDNRQIAAANAEIDRMYKHKVNIQPQEVV